LAGKYNNLRADGSLGQVENIALDTPTHGTYYQGFIEHYSGQPADYELIISVDDEYGHRILEVKEGTLSAG